MRTQEFELKNRNGKNIKGIEFIPEGDGVFPTVIYSHGFNSNFCELMHHGGGFAEAGIVCIFFDFCGGGLNTKSEGTMKEMTVLTEVNDLEDVIADVATRPYVDMDKLFLCGESQGGFVSAYLAAIKPEAFRGIILWYPAFIIPDDCRRRFSMNDDTCLGIDMSPDYNLVAKDMDIYEIIKSYTKPVIIIHGDNDRLVPIEYSRKALSVYESAELIEIKDARHGFDGEDSVNAREYSIAFMKKLI